MELIYIKRIARYFFKPGGALSHIVGNLDITKVLSDKTSIGFGSEIRNETFEIFEGKASWDGFVPIHFR
jgi:iron complex outermembrane receptor protein